MSHINYKGNHLSVEEVLVSDIADKVSTPFYCYSLQSIIDSYSKIKGVFKNFSPLICYSLKANSNLAIVKTLANLGSGADVGSEGELRKALKAGIPPNKIVFSGVGKSINEILYALESEIYQFNVESEAELNFINSIALEKNVKAPITLRVNPDVDANTHQKISTGKAKDKFGIAIQNIPALFEKSKNLNGVELFGLNVHIGSQIMDNNSFNQAFEKLFKLVELLINNGHSIKRIDLGGGIGIKNRNPNNLLDLSFLDYPDSKSLDHYGSLIEKHFSSIGCQIILEPGRAIVGTSGILISKVLYNKVNSDRVFKVIDAGMNDFARPALYDAQHSIIPVKKIDQIIKNKISIVGPVCESGDEFLTLKEFFDIPQDELIAVLSVGAYGACMSSNYNLRPLISEVLVNKNKFSLIRERQTYEDLLNRDIIPSWIGS
jgi:diaminopimelate decarboxylase